MTLKYDGSIHERRLPVNLAVKSVRVRGAGCVRAISVVLRRKDSSMTYLDGLLESVPSERILE